MPLIYLGLALIVVGILAWLVNKYIPMPGNIKTLVNVVLALARPELIPYARLSLDGLDRIPSTGPAIVAANHRSYFDPLAIGVAVARAGRSVRWTATAEWPPRCR